MLNSSSISLFSMSVLRKLQIAAAPATEDCSLAIIGAGAVECQKAVRAMSMSRMDSCFTAAR
jgi:hypothetical protein